MSYLETPDGSPRKTRISRRVRSVHDVLSPQSKVDALLLLTPTTSYKINKERDERKSEAKIRRFVICLILMHLFTGMLLFSVKTYATTIERRYGLSASMIGLIVAGSDIGHLISLIPSALAASRFSRPVLISFGGMLMALGGAMCCFPHFLCGLYIPLTHQMTNASESLLGGDTLTLYSPEMCFKRNAISPNPRYEDEFNNLQSSYDHFKALFGNSSLYGGLKGSGDELTLPKMLCTKSEIEIIFIISTLFMGFGAGPVVTLHFSYIDDFTSPSKSPLYIAAVQTCSIIGVILSYAVAGFSSNLYVDIGRVNVGTTVLQPGDVQWVGAWWLGFVIAASGSLIFSLPMMYFDDETEFNDVFNEETNLLQGSKSSGRHVAERGNTKINVAKHHILSPVRRTKYKSVVTDDDVIHPLQHIATNPVVIISLISTVGWHFQPLSSGTFVLKYLQQEFLMSVSTSSLTVGAIIWLPAVLGIPLGGYLYSKLKWNDKQATWFIAILMILASIYYPAGCPATEVVGLTTVTMETGICAASCSCNPDVLNFDPVCGDDSRTYITPCYAGCSKIISKNRTLEPKFDDCMCIGLLEPGDLGATTNSTGAKNGFCSNTCGRYQLPIFVINFVLRVLVLCMTYVPYGVFLMRSVRPTDKAVAIALKEIVGKLFGEIPGSILTGKLFDSCCQFWSKAESGGCQFYDLEVLWVRYFLVNIIPSAVAALSFVLSITFLKNKTRKPELPDIVISPASPATGGMSKRKSEDPHGGAKEGESEEEEGLFPPKVPRVATSTELPTEEQPGPSHRVFPVQRGEPVEFGAMRGLPQPSLRTRGPGRPRIHPPKPAGVSRPRGRPKGSKNKKPRKRIERPPKRPRGRPRKWPPEMWEGFQRTREAAVQQQLKQQQQQQQQQHHMQQHHEMAGPSHMYMEQQRDPRILQQMQMVHPHQMPPQPPMPHYMQLPLETEQPQEEISLLMPPQSLPQEHMLPSMMLPEQQHPEQIQEQEELLWMPHEEMPPHHQRPPHTTSQ